MKIDSKNVHPGDERFCNMCTVGVNKILLHAEFFWCIIIINVTCRTTYIILIAADTSDTVGAIDSADAIGYKGRRTCL